MNAPIIIPPEVTQEVNAVALLHARAESLTVTTQDEYAYAGEAAREIARMRKELEKRRKEMTGPLDEAKKKIMDFFRAPGEKLERAEKLIGSKMLAWKAEQDRARREAEAAAAEAARKERERLEKRAAAAAKKGQEEKAAALAEAAASMPAAPVVHMPEAKADGISTRTVWRWDIVNKDQIPREYMMPDEKMIAAIVHAKKGDTDIPGIRVFSEETLVKRT